MSVVLLICICGAYVISAFKRDAQAELDRQKTKQLIQQAIDKISAARIAPDEKIYKIAADTYAMLQEMAATPATSSVQTLSRLIGLEEETNLTLKGVQATEIASLREKLRVAILRNVPEVAGIRLKRAAGKIASLAMDPDDSSFLVGASDGNVYRDESRSPLFTLENNDEVVAVIAGVSAYVAIGRRGSVATYNKSSGKVIRRSIQDVHTEIYTATSDQSSAWLSLRSGGLCHVVLETNTLPVPTCVDSKEDRVFENDDRVVLLQVGHNRVIRYSTAKALIEDWHAETGALLVAKVDATHDVQSLAPVGVGKYLTGSRTHNLEPLGFAPPSRSVPFGATPTRIAPLDHRSAIVGTYAGAVQIYNYSQQSFTECPKEIYLGADPRPSPVIWLGAVDGSRLAMALTGNGVLSVVDRQGCAVIWRQAVGIRRVKHSLELAPGILAVVGYDSSYAIVRPQEIFTASGLASVVEAASVVGAGMRNDVWPIFVQKAGTDAKAPVAKALAIVRSPDDQQTVRIADILPEKLFLDASFLDATTILNRGHTFLVAVNSSAIFVVDLEGYSKHRMSVGIAQLSKDGKNRQEKFRIRASVFHDDTLLVVADDGSKSERHVWHLTFDAIASEAIARIEAPGLEYHDRVSWVDVNQVSNDHWIPKNAEGLNSASVVGVTTGPAPSDDALLVFHGDTSTKGRYAIVTRTDAAIVERSTLKKPAQFGIASLGNGFAILDVDGQVATITRGARVGSSESSPRVRDVAALQGAGCAISVSSDESFLVAGGQGDLLIASTDGSYIEPIQTGSDRMMCALAAVTSEERPAVAWITPEGVQMRAICDACLANWTVEQALRGLAKRRTNTYP